MQTKKIRLDLAMVQQGLEVSRERAKARIMAGAVSVGGEVHTKAGDMVPDDALITLKEQLPYVSRGGLKLAKIMSAYALSLRGAVCMDVGASTGGFSDCMLQNGAKKVYAVDVGYGQLAWKLQTDSRVVSLERTNIRYVTRGQIPDPLDFVSIDVSFISLKLVLPVVHELLKEDGQVACLIKPQFEAGREKVGKKGVVRDSKTHLEVCRGIYEVCISLGFCVQYATYSPIKGPAGNIEFLFVLQKSTSGASIPAQSINTVVEQAHAEMGEK